MKRNLSIPALALFAFFMVGPAVSADLQKGNAAYQRGDYAAAVSIWTSLAEQGDADAQESLGYMYHSGDGVLQDYKMAHMWFNIAASLGDKSAAKSREIIEKKMSSSDISKAQDLARQCVKKKYKGC